MMASCKGEVEMRKLLNWKKEKEDESEEMERGEGDCDEAVERRF